MSHKAGRETRASRERREGREAGAGHCEEDRPEWAAAAAGMLACTHETAAGCALACPLPSHVHDAHIAAGNIILTLASIARPYEAGLATRFLFNRRSSFTEFRRVRSRIIGNGFTHRMHFL